VREGGWALRAYVGLWLGTGEQRWRDESRRLIEMFLDWHDEYGALLAPYTSHTMPRVPFMISLTVNSFARYLLIEDDERVKKLIVSVMDDLIEHCLGPDGVFYYKELPSLQRTAPTPHAFEALTYAWRVTGNERYLKIAANTFAALMANLETKESGPKFADPSGAVIDGIGGGRIFADKYTSLILYAGAEGYLDDVPVEKVADFERALHEQIQATAAGVVEAIESTGELDDATEEQLKAAIEQFKGSVAY
jgi:hypothetical protein